MVFKTYMEKQKLIENEENEENLVKKVS